jgi:hypothetical protein
VEPSHIGAQLTCSMFPVPPPPMLFWPFYGGTSSMTTDPISNAHALYRAVGFRAIEAVSMSVISRAAEPYSCCSMDFPTIRTSMTTSSGSPRVGRAQNGHNRFPGLRRV